ncbi:hypothetical protein [Liquorilactobacillus nagelii]|uniref:hypothetical protein n=1 Tax=Liquorilactobacillus nagelii TaxID=82688 RepID=UPI0039EC8D9E
MSYQVRLSYETVEFLEELKKMYEEIEHKPIVKGEVLNRAYYDSQWVESWQDIYIRKIKLNGKYDIKENSLRPRLQITVDVEQGIKKLKLEIAEQLGLRSVTIGVVIRLILKAALIKNNFSGENDISYIFPKYKKEVEKEFQGEQKEKVLQLLKKMEIEINKVLGK